MSHTLRTQWEKGMFALSYRENGFRGWHRIRFSCPSLVMVWGDFSMFSLSYKWAFFSDFVGESRGILKKDCGGMKKIS
jgi:hypothetical protein